MKESTTESIEDYPKLKDGHIDFMTMVEQMFPGQLQVISYMKGLMRGYALDKSLQTAHNLMKKLDEGNTSVTMEDIVPEEIKPVDVKDTQNDTD